MEQIKPLQNGSVVTRGASPMPHEQKAEARPVVKKLSIDNNARMKLLVSALIVVVAGVGTGWALSGASAREVSPSPTSNVASELEGGVDETMFSDSATGVLYEGGINGEGTHYLDTGAGAEKYVYLLSTVINLQSFVGKKVEVSGQTLAAEHAGWLMDVARIKEVR